MIPDEVLREKRADGYEAPSRPVNARGIYEMRRRSIEEPEQAIAERRDTVGRKNSHFVANRQLLTAVIVAAAVFVCGVILILEMVGAFK
jgi:hypothetical protein